MDNDSEHLPLIEDDKYVPSNPLELYKKSFSDIRNAPRELWLIFIIRFGIIGGFSVFFLSLPIYITEVKSLPDMTISIVYGLSGITCMFYLLFFGSIPDRYGIKFSLVLGSLILIINSVIFIIFNNSIIQFASIISLGSFSLVITSVALDLSIKHYTSLNYRSLAISLYTAVNYLALITGGILIEVLMNKFDKNESTFKIIFLYCAVNFAIAFILSMFLRKLDYSVYQEQVLEHKELKSSFWKHTRHVLVLKKFWRLCVLVVVVLLIKIIFYQQTVMLPLYMDRDLGDDSHYGLMIILNQVVIIFTLPLFAYLNYFSRPYDIFISGGFIAVLSLVPFMFGPSYLTVVLYIIISSLGESLYGPKVLEYSLGISPKGKEGLILALISLPGILSSILSGVVAGVLLEEYCPEDGNRKCWLMWAIIGILALIGILVLIVFRKCLEEPDFESQPYMPCSKESQGT